MNIVNDITENFGTLYHPKSALVFYETIGTNTDVYVEHDNRYRSQKEIW